MINNDCLVDDEINRRRRRRPPPPPPHPLQLKNAKCTQMHQSCIVSGTWSDPTIQLSLSLSSPLCRYARVLRGMCMQRSAYVYARARQAVVVRCNAGARAAARQARAKMRAVATAARGKGALQWRGAPAYARAWQAMRATQWWRYAAR